jgi:hypothetical protein
MLDGMPDMGLIRSCELLLRFSMRLRSLVPKKAGLFLKGTLN